MESESPEHSVPLHPWEGPAVPSGAEDEARAEHDVDPVGPGPVDEEAALSRANDPRAPFSPETTGGVSADLAQAVYGSGQSAERVIAALRNLRSARPTVPAMATRLTPDVLEAVQLEFPSVAVHEIARACVLGELVPAQGQVWVIAGGDADAAVAHEAAVTTRVFGADVETLTDVSAVEIHEMLTTDRLPAADCLIVVSGMEGSLPSVVAGLTNRPVVAVPTSVGYGSSFGGMAALLAMLNACAPGVVVCNIDNGFGAGVFAARVARGATRPPHATIEPVSAD